jgi:hypothetical protein
MTVIIPYTCPRCKKPLVKITFHKRLALTTFRCDNRTCPTGRVTTQWDEVVRTS